jgi:hypothetical protein
MKWVLLTGAALIVASPGVAQVLQNPNFSSGLDHWYTANGVDWREHPQTPGSVSWSNAHGGSALMVVSGAPSSVDLIQSTGEDLSPGDELIFHVWTSGMTSATFAVQVGTDGNGGESEQLVQPGDGEHRLVLRLRRSHDRGTLVQLVLVTWPGNGMCWVTGVERGGR